MITQKKMFLAGGAVVLIALVFFMMHTPTPPSAGVAQTNGCNIGIRNAALTTDDRLYQSKDEITASIPGAKEGVSIAVFYNSDHPVDRTMLQSVAQENTQAHFFLHELPSSTNKSDTLSLNEGLAGGLCLSALPAYAFHVQNTALSNTHVAVDVLPSFNHPQMVTEDMINKMIGKLWEQSRR